jgi:hypothetical protein
MAKRKTQKPQVAGCDPEARPRRSIPVEEVNRIVEHAVREVKSQRTIYDDRLALLDCLNHNEQQINDYEDLLHRTKLRNKELRLDLAQVNLAITRQMELDGE